MPYSMNMIQFGVLPTQQLTASNTRLGFPTTFDYFLFSMWVCLGTSSRVISFSDQVPFFFIAAQNSSLHVILQRGVSSPALNHTFSVPISNYRSNILLSVQLSTNTLQLYVNDQPIVETLSWTGSGTFNLSGAFNNWDLTPAGSSTPGAGIGDVYANNPASFFDLSVTANRRQFIASDLTPVDLGSTGSNPTGSQPPVYLTVRPGDMTPNDFATNNGSGGSLTISNGPLTFEAGGACAILPPPNIASASLADMWFGNTTSFVDLSNATNRRLFIASNGGGEDLGSNGQFPFGTTPPVFLTRSPVQVPDAWANNVGSGGSYTLTGGDLTAPSSGPPCSPDFTAFKPLVFFAFANIGSTPLCIVFYADGSIDQVNMNTNAVTVIGGPGTIQNPSVLTVGVSQWGSPPCVLIVAQQTNGYWIWTGTILTGAGTISPFIQITNNGSGYSSNPTVTISGGSGSGAVLQAVVTGGLITSIIVVNPGSGWLVGETVTVNISDPTGTGAAATASLMPFGVWGTTVEVYTSHVWIAQPSSIVAGAPVTFYSSGAQLLFSAPDDPTNFATSAGGGITPITDSFTRVLCAKLLQNNGFLWLICDSSISYISNVTTQGTSPPVTTFTKQNANPEVGTPWPTAVQTFGQYLVFGNPFGVHVQTGGSVEKISEPLDGIYNTVPNFAGLVPSTGKAIVFGKKSFVMLLPVIDQISGQQVNKLMMWAGKGWWTSQQDVPLIFIAGQEINSVQTTYGTDGKAIYPLFAQPSIAFSKTTQSKLFGEPTGYIDIKTVSRLWGIVQYYSNLSPALTVSVDNESGLLGQDVTITTAGGSGNIVLGIIWHTATGLVMNWTTATGAPMIWGAVGSATSVISVIPPLAVAQQGILLGMTITTNCADMAILSMALGPVAFIYRG